jgi:PTH1 family peptidyl-tRNA hydrolase
MALLGPHFIIGLGNPGKEYERTRHNAGFAVIDAFAAEIGVNYWKIASNALVGEANWQGEKIVLVKPQSFMNLSGGPVRGLAARYGFGVEDVFVIHDELDLPAGVLRLKLGGGHAGHNGLRSLHQAFGPDYSRLRIGIGRPPGRVPAHAYVLQRMGAREFEDFEVTVAQAVSVVRSVLKDGLAQAMNEYNRDGGAAAEEATNAQSLTDSLPLSFLAERSEAENPANPHPQSKASWGPEGNRASARLRDRQIRGESAAHAMDPRYAASPLRKDDNEMSAAVTVPLPVLSERPTGPGPEGSPEYPREHER